MPLAEAREAESTGVGRNRRESNLPVRRDGNVSKAKERGGVLRKKDVRMTRKQAKLLNCAHFMIVFFVMLDLKLKSNSS